MPVTIPSTFPAAVWLVTDEAASEAAFESGAFLDSSRGRGFFASSALNPGGGNSEGPLPLVEVSVA